MRISLAACLSIPFLLTTSPAASQRLRGDIHAGFDVASSDSEQQTGATYGLSLSYDLVMRDANLAIQLDLDATDNRACSSDLLVTGDQACIEGQRDTALSVQFGRRVGAAATLYALAGYANARFAADYEAAGVRSSVHRTLDGVRLGVGAMVDISRRVYLKAEYRYTNYEDDVSRNQGVVGLGLRF